MGTMLAQKKIFTTCSITNGICVGERGQLFNKSLIYLWTCVHTTPPLLDPHVPCEDLYKLHTHLTCSQNAISSSVERLAHLSSHQQANGEQHAAVTFIFQLQALTNSYVYRCFHKAYSIHAGMMPYMYMLHLYVHREFLVNQICILYV